VKVVASLSQGRTAAAQCGLFTHKSVPVIFEPPCNFVQTLHEKLNCMFSGTAQVSHQVCQLFLVSSLCLLVRVTMVDKNKAVVCCLLATSAVILCEKKKRKRKIWSKKWYLKINISCGAPLLNELLETDAPWNDATVAWAGKLRKLWGSLSELRSSVCERRLERTVLRAALLPVKTAQFTQFFRQIWRRTVKSLGLTESV